MTWNGFMWEEMHYDTRDFNCFVFCLDSYKNIWLQNVTVDHSESIAYSERSNPQEF